MASATFTEKKTPFFTSKLDLNIWKEVLKCCIFGIALYGSESWTLQKVDKKYLENFIMRCWRRIWKTLWGYRVKNEVLRIFQEEKNILLTIKRQKVKWIGCLLKHFFEGMIEGKTKKNKKQEEEEGKKKKKKKNV